MNTEHSEEEIILYDDEEKYDGIINAEEVDCECVRKSSRERRPVERLKPQLDNEKSHLQLIE